MELPVDSWLRGNLPPDIKMQLLDFSTDGFIAPASRLTSGAIANLPWATIKIYCATFFMASILLLSAVCSMWAYWMCKN